MIRLVMRTVLLAAVAACLLVPSLAGIAADDGPAAGGSPPGADERRDDSGQPKQADPADDDALFRKLLPGSTEAEKPDEDLLERAVRGMRSATERIDEGDSGSETRALQEAVVNDLEELIEKLKQQQRQPRSSRSTAQSRPRRTGLSESGSTEDSPANPDQKQPAESTPGDGGQTKDGNAAESSGRPREAEQRNASGPLTKTDLVRDVWGHLPPKQRQKLLNGYSDKYLPKYDDIVRRYFAALAEEGRTSKRTRPGF